MIGSRLRALLSATLGASASPFPAPLPCATSSAVVDAIEAIEAADFVDADAEATFDRFGLIAMSLDAAVRRDREGLALIEAIEANPRAHGRSHGLEWGYEQLFIDAVRLRQCAELMRKLAPHEKQVRALLDLGEVRT